MSIHFGHFSYRQKDRERFSFPKPCHLTGLKFYYTYYAHADFGMEAKPPFFVRFYVKPTIINLN